MSESSFSAKPEGFASSHPGLPPATVGWGPLKGDRRFPLAHENPTNRAGSSDHKTGWVPETNHARVPLSSGPRNGRALERAKRSGERRASEAEVLLSPPFLPSRSRLLLTLFSPAVVCFDLVGFFRCIGLTSLGKIFPFIFLDFSWCDLGAFCPKSVAGVFPMWSEYKKMGFGLIYRLRYPIFPGFIRQNSDFTFLSRSGADLGSGAFLVESMASARWKVGSLARFLWHFWWCSVEPSYRSGWLLCSFCCWH